MFDRQSTENASCRFGCCHRDEYHYIYYKGDAMCSVEVPIDMDHIGTCFKPCGIPRDELETVVIYEDEMEAIRLADLESLYQEDSASKMGISRTTFARLIQSAHQKNRRCSCQ